MEFYGDENFMRIRGIQQNIICGYERSQKVSTGLAVVNTAGDDNCTRCIIVTSGILYKLYSIIFT